MQKPPDKNAEKSATRKVLPVETDGEKAPTRKLSAADNSSENDLTLRSLDHMISAEEEATLRAVADHLTANENAKTPDAQRPSLWRIRELLAAGKVLQGKYQIVKMIGAGGMGQVYQARHLVLGNMVAIKVINRDLIPEDDREAMERFEREARTNASIEHPNAVRVFDFGIEENLCFLVMEYLEGESLRSRLKRDKRLPISQVIEFNEQVCLVLDLMHRKGIVHRDLKPDNIFFHRQDDLETIKVLDFGIAKMSSNNTHLEGKLTGTGALIGTPHYMSPEQCQGMEIDGRSDLYSLGIIIYEILAGQLPFDAENTLSMLFKHVREVPQPLIEIAPWISAEISLAVMHALAKHPSQRYQTAKEFAVALREAHQKSVNSQSIKPTDLELKLPDLTTKDYQTEATRQLRIGSITDEHNQSEPVEQNAVAAASEQAAVAPRAYPRAPETQPVHPRRRDFQQELPTAESSLEAAIPPTLKVVKRAEQDQSINQVESESPKKPFSPKVVLLSLAVVVAIMVIIPIFFFKSDLKLAPGNAVVDNKNSANNGSTKPPAANPLGDNFVLIPGGSFSIGNDTANCATITDCKVTADETPAHTVTLAPYYLSKYELTNREYREFIIATNHAAPKNWRGQDFLLGTEDLPVTFVNWNDAVAYCQWRSKRDGIEFRLPTEAEWEHAARGNDTRLYPWGDNWDNSLVNAAKPIEVSSPLSINTAPNSNFDRSPFGIFALAGNVMEWTASDFQVYPNSEFKAKNQDLECKVIRGGSFNLGAKEVPNALRTTFRIWNFPTRAEKDLGFRLAATVPASNL